MAEDFDQDLSHDYGADQSDEARASYKTIKAKPAHRPTKTFTARLALFFALTAIMTAIVLSVTLAFVWESQFTRYTRQNMQRLAQQTADNLAVQYEEAGGWTDEVLQSAANASSASSEIGVQVMDQDGSIIYDDTWVSARRAHSQAGSSSGSSSDETTTSEVSTDGSGSLVPTSSDSIVSADVLDKTGNKVGSVRLWAFGSDALLTTADATFRMNSYSAIVAAALFATVIACVIGYLASRSLTRPIKIITQTAAQIRNGDLSARTGLRGEDEIGRLGETFDSMAETMEHDIKFERSLTSDVAHELRTPLMAMLATVEAMQDGVLPADYEHFETVASEVRRLSRLVDAMLHLSRLENGKRAFKPEETEVVELTRALFSMQEQLFADQGLSLTFEDRCKNGECYAEVDPDLLREATVNLLSNAMRYTPEGGSVVLAVAKERNDVLISVEDTGIGIAKEDIPRVFSRFWRSDASRERVSGGLGVGLAITKEIVDLHNGTISVESELGEGTTFTLHIPRRHKTLAQAIQQNAQQRGGGQTGSKEDRHASRAAAREAKQDAALHEKAYREDDLSE